MLDCSKTSNFLSQNRTSADMKRTDTSSSADGFETPSRSKSSLGIFQLGGQSSQTNMADYYVLYVSSLEPADMSATVQEDGTIVNKSHDGVAATTTSRQFSVSDSSSWKNDSMTPELRKLGLASDC
jgi:hypothetical protein